MQVCLIASGEYVEVEVCTWVQLPFKLWELNYPPPLDKQRSCEVEISLTW